MILEGIQLLTLLLYIQPLLSFHSFLLLPFTHILQKEKKKKERQKTKRPKQMSGLCLKEKGKILLQIRKNKLAINRKNWKEQIRNYHRKRVSKNKRQVIKTKAIKWRWRKVWNKDKNREKEIKLKKKFNKVIKRGNRKGKGDFRCVWSW